MKLAGPNCTWFAYYQLARIDRSVIARNNNYFIFLMVPIWFFSGVLYGHLRSTNIMSTNAV